jgi:hypothetical protein
LLFVLNIKLEGKGTSLHLTFWTDPDSKWPGPLVHQSTFCLTYDLVMRERFEHKVLPSFQQPDQRFLDTDFHQNKISIRGIRVRPKSAKTGPVEKCFTCMFDRENVLFCLL